jgi:hypothetical protein
VNTDDDLSKIFSFGSPQTSKRNGHKYFEKNRQWALAEKGKTEYAKQETTGRYIT